MTSLATVQFRVSTLDVGVPEEAEQIVQLAESMGPVGGVFHLAMYLADKLITNQVWRNHRPTLCSDQKNSANASPF